MKSIIATLLLMIGFSSCNNSITGLYKPKIFHNAPGGSIFYDLCENGRFTYCYSICTLGPVSFTGDWIRKGDTLILKTDKYLFDTKTNLIYNRDGSPDLTEYQIGLLPKYFKCKRDTTYLCWLVKIVDESLIFKAQEKSIMCAKQYTVRDYYGSLGITPLVEQTEPVLSFNDNPNDVRFFFADTILESIIFWGDKKMLVKGRKLITLLPDSIQNTPLDECIRVNRKCGNLKNELKTGYNNVYIK